jgi:CheY-like chemotaxis protein
MQRRKGWLEMLTIVPLLAADTVRTETRRVAEPLARPEQPYILIVDDEAEIRSLIKDVLEMEGYTVMVAANGAEVRIAADAPPALILLDLMMPVVDGYELGRRLRADPTTAGIPFVVMSAGARAAHAAKQLGANGCLAKPFDLAALLDTVAAYARPPAG